MRDSSLQHFLLSSFPPCHRHTDHTFTTFKENEHRGWGWDKLLPLKKLFTPASGFLRAHDGALLIRLDLEYQQAPAAAGQSDPRDGSSYPATISSTSSSGGGSGDGGTQAASAMSELSSDFLALLEDPHPTSDLTISATASAAPGDSGETSSAVAGGAECSRRFPVHRAILAARCPYFATHFASGLGDSNTRELHLPDTDPDALAALLRFMYGGELRVASREQAWRCLALADRLLLPKAAGLLRAHLLATLSPTTVMADLMWAAGLAEGQGQAELLTGLISSAAEMEEDIPEAQVEQLAAAHPALVAQLFTARFRASKRLRSAPK